jgi:DNA-binding LytR/AlgR family response regulator
MYTGMEEFKDTIAILRFKITHCEANGNHAKAFLVNNEYWYLDCCLANVEIMLHDDDFLRCHKSTLVNHSYIMTIDFNTNLITLEKGKKLTASYRELRKIRAYLKRKGYEILSGFLNKK